MAVQKLRNLAEGRNAVNSCFVFGHFRKIFFDRFFHKQALRVLGEHCKAAMEQLRRFVFLHGFSEQRDLATVRTANTGDGFQRCGLASAVAAEDSIQAPGGNLGADTSENIGAVLFVAEPQFFQSKHRILDFLRQGRGGNSVFHWLLREFPAEPAAALANR